LDHFSGALLFGRFADVWASFFVMDSLVQYLPDQAAKFSLIPNLEMGLRQLGFEEYRISKEDGTFESSSVLRIHQNQSNS